MAYDLQAIRDKIRKLTGRNSQTQLTDASIDDYINQYYTYGLPQSLKLLKLKDVFTFITVPNVDTYPAPLGTDLYFAPPATCAGIRIDYFNNNETFYTRWPKRNFVQIVANGNGGPGPYIGNLTNFPILASVNPGAAISQTLNVLISVTSAGVNQVATDDGVGGYVGAVGAINYITGAFNITFPFNVDAGTPIYFETVPYVASRPTSLMFWQSEFVLRPVPDNAYIVEVNTLRNPTQLLAAGDHPELLEWWMLLAYGAANQILIDNADYEILAQLSPHFEEQTILCMRRVITQGASQRASTLFSENNQYPFGNNYPYI